MKEVPAGLTATMVDGGVDNNAILHTHTVVGMKREARRAFSSPLYEA